MICTKSDETAAVVDTAVADIAAASTVVVATAGSIVAAGTAVAGSMTPRNGGTGSDGCYPKHCDPFVGNKLDAVPTTSFSFPSYACGYQNRACFCIL